MGDTIKSLSTEEITRLLSVITSKRDKALFTVAYYHGLRIGEVGMLQESHYVNGQLFVPRLKNGIAKFHDLNKTQTRLLNSWISLRGKRGPNSPIFISRMGNPISVRQVDKLMHRYSAKAKLPDDRSHFHVLRHSCATHMTEMDVPVIKIKEWLGHKDIRSTMVYADVSTKALRDTAAAWYTGGKVGSKGTGIDWSKD